MKKFFGFIFLAGAILAVLTVIFSVYIVDETEQAVVKEFGQIKYVIKEPGVHFKLPWRNVNFYDKRILSYDDSPTEVLTRDKKQVVMDNYACWIIKDAAVFEASLGSIDNAKKIMHEIILSEFRIQIGSYDLIDIIRERDEMLKNVLESSNEKLYKMGIELVDVRIKKTDLPKENFASVVRRMTAERETMASRYRAEGRQQAVEIESHTDRVSDSLVQSASKESAIIRARADSIAISIYNEKFGHDRDFFEFVKTLEMYRNTVDSAKVLIIPNNSSIYRLLTTGKL